MHTNIEINSQAPDFTLKNTEGDEISLADFKGKRKIVLLFFPLAFAEVSANVLRATRDNMKLYSSLDAKVIGISVDSYFVLNALKRAENLNFTLLSDFNKEVCRRYGTLSDDFFGMKGVSKQATFIIDREGLIQYKRVLEDAEGNLDFRKIQKTLASID